MPGACVRVSYCFIIGFDSRGVHRFCGYWTMDVLMYLCVTQQKAKHQQPVWVVVRTWRTLQVLPVDPSQHPPWRSAELALREAEVLAAITWWWNLHQLPKASPASRLIEENVWYVLKMSAAVITKDGKPSFVNLYSTWPGQSRWVSDQNKPIHSTWQIFYRWKLGESENYLTSFWSRWGGEGQQSVFIATFGSKVKWAF